MKVTCPISVIYCTKLPAWDNLDVDTNVSTYGTIVHASCSEGYKFSDGSKLVYIVTECASAGVWEPPVPQCIGKYIKPKLTKLKANRSKDYTAIWLPF